MEEIKNLGVFIGSLGVIVVFVGLLVSVSDTWGRKVEEAGILFFIIGCFVAVAGFIIFSVATSHGIP